MKNQQLRSAQRTENSTGTLRSAARGLARALTPCRSGLWNAARTHSPNRGLQPASELVFLFCQFCALCIWQVALMTCGLVCERPCGWHHGQKPSLLLAAVYGPDKLAPGTRATNQQGLCRGLGA